LGLEWVVSRAAIVGGAGCKQGRHNYTLIAPTSPDLRFRRVSAALWTARHAAVAPTI